MKISRILIIIVAVILAGVLLFFQFFKNTTKDKANKSKESGFGKLVSQLEGFVVKPSKLVQEIDVSGSIQPFDETVIMPEIPGRVVKLNLNEGRAVTKGTLLVKLFDDDLQAQLKMLEVQLKIAQNNEARMNTLLKIQGTSQQEYDASLLQVNNLNAQIEILKVNISKTEIRAPYNGILGLKKISVGQFIAPSTQIITIRAVNTLKLDFSIPERYGAVMTPGTKIEFNVAGIEKTLEATVIANESSIESESRNLNVRALISGSTKGIIPGSFAKVKANLGDKNNALMIPTSAIIPQASEKKVYISKNGKAALVSIKTGIRQSGDIEVISGIEEGDTLVVTGILFVKPNSLLKFSKVK